MIDQTKPYTPLNTDNSALVLVDHQVGLMTGVRDYETGELKHNVVALAKAARVLRIPTVVTTTARDSMWGPTFPELADVVACWPARFTPTSTCRGRRSSVRSRRHTASERHDREP
jgi:nicotinamidase-related amidase